MKSRCVYDKEVVSKAFHALSPSEIRKCHIPLHRNSSSRNEGFGGYGFGGGLVVLILVK